MEGGESFDNLGDTTRLKLTLAKPHHTHTTRKPSSIFVKLSAFRSVTKGCKYANNDLLCSEVR